MCENSNFWTKWPSFNLRYPQWGPVLTMEYSNTFFTEDSSNPFRDAQICLPRIFTLTPATVQPHLAKESDGKQRKCSITTDNDHKPRQHIHTEHDTLSLIYGPYSSAELWMTWGTLVPTSCLFRFNWLRYRFISNSTENTFQRHSSQPIIGQYWRKLALTQQKPRINLKKTKHN